MLKILNEDGEEILELKLGQKFPPDRAYLLNQYYEFLAFAKASGLEREECLRILGRRPVNAVGFSGTTIPPAQLFGNEATKEILLNWGL